jgi:hypothetical protein
MKMKRVVRVDVVVDVVVVVVVVVAAVFMEAEKNCT